VQKTINITKLNERGERGEGRVDRQGLRVVFKERTHCFRSGRTLEKNYSKKVITLYPH